MKKLIVLTVLLAGLGANATPTVNESSANDALNYMIFRYHATKADSNDTNREISLACAGEVFKDFVDDYLQQIQLNHLNTNVIVAYNKAIELKEAHLSDAENIYPKLRSNLIEALRQTLTGVRTKTPTYALPTMTITNYGQPPMELNFQLCNNTDFINEVARLSPLSGSYNDTVEGQTYKIPVTSNDGSDYGSIIDNGAPDRVAVTVKQPLKQWLYEIYRR
jgi:hypothetical protein